MNYPRHLPAFLLIALSVSVPAFCQPIPLSPSQLDQLVSRIALYPDPLLAQILTAATDWSEIPAAADWANQHSYLTGDALAAAIKEDNLLWAPTVLALLPFPSVLEMMAQDPAWTQQLANAVLTQRAEVMDAVQRMRRKAREFGYLQSSLNVNVVDTGGYVEILPVTPGLICVPTYDPLVVFAPPRPGFAISGAIRFGPGITIGASFAPWGWASAGFVWSNHTLLIDHAPWTRHWENRAVYAHPYAHPWVRALGPVVEHHEIKSRKR